MLNFGTQNISVYISVKFWLVVVNSKNFLAVASNGRILFFCMNRKKILVVDVDVGFGSDWRFG